MCVSLSIEREVNSNSELAIGDAGESIASESAEHHEVGEHEQEPHIADDAETAPEIDPIPEFISQPEMECTSGISRPCYTGPSRTQDVGICKEGTQTCEQGKWGICQGQILPEEKENCGDDLDNNCNGIIDEGCPCNYLNKPHGVCVDATRDDKGMCQKPEHYSETESCGDVIDNNCDGVINENCPCHYLNRTFGVCAKSTRDDKGECKKPADFSETENCGDGKDNNCDGVIDEGCSCNYLHKPHGVCKDLTRDAFGNCPTPANYNKDEICGDGKDNNCDGVIDEGCNCHYLNKPHGVCTGLTRDAQGNCPKPENYSEKEDCTVDLDNNCDGAINEGCHCHYLDKPYGVCKELIRDVSGNCPTPANYSKDESCGNNLDNNCDGVIDEGCPCDYLDKPHGVCKGLTRDAKGNCPPPHAYSETERCGDNLDNNCNGVIDEGCDCTPGEIRSCGSDVGTCEKGTQTCSDKGKWQTECQGAVGPVPEICGDGKDNNCDGAIDEGCPCDYLNKAHGVCKGLKRDAKGNCPRPANYSDAEICGDGKDNNCDGAINEGCPCHYLDKPHGVCKDLKRDAKGECPKPVQYSSTEICGNNLDNNCDGAINEGCPCHYLDKPQGVCKDLKRDANGECPKPANYSSTEICGNNLDNNCNGVADEGCPCNYLDKPHGVCAKATRNAQGICQKPANYSETEKCSDNLDNNCNGYINEKCPCNYLGKTKGVCVNGTIGNDGTCKPPANYSETEKCSDGLDNNCNGVIDEGCPCNYLGKTQGVCKNAVRNDRGECPPPKGYNKTEICGDGLDNDCDGLVDKFNPLDPQECYDLRGDICYKGTRECLSTGEICLSPTKTGVECKNAQNDCAKCPDLPNGSYICKPIISHTAQILYCHANKNDTQ